MKDARHWIEKLGLQKHPEGGWYREIYGSEEMITTASGKRNVCTSIYYLLEGDDFSAFHRIKSDEIWHFYTGTSAIEILWIERGALRKVILGTSENEIPQAVIPKNCWFAARLVNAGGFALAGCTVAPGFHFDDFELADGSLLVANPDLTDEIRDLIRH